MSSDQFELLRSLGLREHHQALDIGCGALGLGSLLIPYLQPRHYFGIEPQQALIEDGVRFHLGHDLFDLKEPQFLTGADFAFHKFAVKFDFMMAHALFPHIDSSLIRNCLNSAAVSLKPDGLLLATWMPGSNDYEGDGWNPNIQAEYKVTTLQSIAQESGLGFKILRRPHPSGQTWAAFYVPGCQRFPDEPTIEAALPPAAPGHAGYVEQIQDVGGYQLIVGWAIDPHTRLPADRVLVTGPDGSVRAAIPVNHPRPDTAAVLGSEALMSGFRALIQSEASPEFACYAIVENTAYLLIK